MDDLIWCRTDRIVYSNPFEMDCHYRESFLSRVVVVIVIIYKCIARSVSSSWWRAAWTCCRTGIVIVHIIFLGSASQLIEENESATDGRKLGLSRRGCIVIDRRRDKTTLALQTLVEYVCCNFGNKIVLSLSVWRLSFNRNIMSCSPHPSWSSS